MTNRTIPGFRATISPIKLLAGVLFALGTGAMALPGAAVAQDLCPERYHVEVDGERLSLPFCSNMPIDQPNAAVRRIVFSIHGVSTNAGTYYRNMIAAAERVPGALDETLVIGPKLMTRSFANSNDILPTDVFWNSSSGRFWGGPSGSSDEHPRNVSISSFEIFDRMLADLLAPGLFPNLEIVVLAGHSGGGQFMNRYAMASSVEDRVAAPRGVHVRYVVAQPSSHTYLTNERVDPESRTRRSFRVPTAAEIEDCPNYDRYGSGLQGLEDWPYMRDVGPERMLAQYGRRDVIYFHGMEDSDPDGAQLARGCAAMLQGAHRLERGLTYFNYVNHLYGAASHNHRISLVARVGHNNGQMWASEQGLLHIFDYPVTIEESPIRRR